MGIVPCMNPRSSFARLRFLAALEGSPTYNRFKVRNAVPLPIGIIGGGLLLIGVGSISLTCSSVAMITASEFRSRLEVLQRYLNPGHFLVQFLCLR